MSYESELHEAEQELCDRFNNGELTQKQYSKELNLLYREYRSMRDEACRTAYDNEAENWD